MELAELKKEILASLEQVNDEEALLEVAEVLEMYSQHKANYHEESAQFWQHINKARQSIADGKGIPDHKARQIISHKIRGSA